MRFFSADEKALSSLNSRLFACLFVCLDVLKPIVQRDHAISKSPSGSLPVVSVHSSTSILQLIFLSKPKVKQKPKVRSCSIMRNPTFGTYKSL